MDGEGKNYSKHQQQMNTMIKILASKPDWSRIYRNAHPFMKPVAQKYIELQNEKLVKTPESLAKETTV